MTVSGSTTTTTAYYGGLAESANGALSYLLSDALGSATASVSTTTGAVTATQLYGPYGAVRYQSGTLPTSKGYTGQRSDAATSGLDYYGARYYDAVAGQFTSADPLGSVGISTMRFGQTASPPSSASGLPDGSDAAVRSSSAGQQGTDQQARAGAPGRATSVPEPRGSASGATASAPSTGTPLRRAGLNLYLYVQGNPESHTDPTGLFTIGICVSLGGGAGAGGFGQVCAQGGWSPQAGWSGGFTKTAGGGGFAGYGGGASIGLQASTADSVNDLSGWFGYAGGGATAGPIGAGVDGFGGKDGRNRAVYGVDGNASVGGDVYLTGGASYTSVTTFSDFWHGLRSPWEYTPIQSDGGAYMRQLQDWVHQQLWLLMH